MKKCSTCFIEKPISEYYNLEKAKDGKQSMCIVCYKAYFKAWRESRKAQPAKVDGTSKVCLHCRLEKPYSQFGKRSTNKDKKMEYCKECWNNMGKIATKKYNKKRLNSESV
jgi:hypothetical protein